MEKIGTCVKCHKDNVGEDYKFWYGKMVSRKKSGDTITSEYSVNGVEEVFVCNLCIREERRRSIIASIICFLLGLVFFYLYTLYKSGHNDDNLDVLPFFGLISECAAIYGIYHSISKNSEIGAQVGIEKEKEKCKAAGYDYCWSPKELAKLKKGYFKW